MVLRSNKEIRNNIMQKRTDPIEEGQQVYQQWRDNLLANPEFRAVYEEEAAKEEIWLQLVEARQEAGLTQVELARRLGVSQAQVACMENVVMMHIASIAYAGMCRHWAMDFRLILLYAGIGPKKLLHKWLGTIEISIDSSASTVVNSQK
jgi:DNA-binding XRE family transcriptional regulator